jgi:hypothetical protein
MARILRGFDSINHTGHERTPNCQSRGPRITRHGGQAADDTDNGVKERGSVNCSLPRGSAMRTEPRIRQLPDEGTLIGRAAVVAGMLPANAKISQPKRLPL